MVETIKQQEMVLVQGLQLQVWEEVVDMEEQEETDTPQQEAQHMEVQPNR